MSEENVTQQIGNFQSVLRSVELRRTLILQRKPTSRLRLTAKPFVALAKNGGKGGNHPLTRFIFCYAKSLAPVGPGPLSKVTFSYFETLLRKDVLIRFHTIRSIGFASSGARHIS